MKKRILVVDDDSMNLTRTKIILGKDYDVLLAGSGVEALVKLKSETVDMVLLDIDMPEMNGIETFERMKDFAAATPVIFLTASGLEEDVQRHQSGGGELPEKTVSSPGTDKAGGPGA